MIEVIRISADNYSRGPSPQQQNFDVLTNGVENLVEIIIGISLYIVILGGLLSFGKFLNECDNSMIGQIDKESLSSNKF